MLEKHALRYSFSLGTNQVIISDELDPSISGQADALVEVENLILQSLHASNYGEAQELFTQIIQLLKDDSSLTSELVKTLSSRSI